AASFVNTTLRAARGRGSRKELSRRTLALPPRRRHLAEPRRSKMAKKQVGGVVGSGPMKGRGLAGRFAKEGYAVALLSRSTEYSSKLAAELGDARAYACDVSEGSSIAAAFARVNEELGPVDTLVYNAGSGTWGTIDDVSDEHFERAWRVNVLGLFQTVRPVPPPRREANGGNIPATGPTPSPRGNPFTTAFAPAKAAQGSLPQSFARQLGPEGIHVAVVIIDGGIQNRGDTSREEGTYLDADDIAITVHHLARQPRSAWTFEIDVRPFKENW